MFLLFALIYVAVSFYIFSRPYELSALYFIIIGFFTYTVGAIIGAIFFGVILFGKVDFILFLTSLGGVIPGLLACLLLKFILKNRLNKKKVNFNEDILDN